MEQERSRISIRDIPWGSSMTGFNITWVHVHDIGLVGGGKHPSRRESVGHERDEEVDEMAALGLPSSFKTTKKIVYPKGRKRRQPAKEQTEPVGETSLGDSWYQAYDTNYGCYYYYNVALQKTQWEPPDCKYVPLGDVVPKESCIDITEGMQIVSLNDGAQQTSELENNEDFESEGMGSGDCNGSQALVTDEMDICEVPDPDLGPSEIGTVGCPRWEKNMEPVTDMDTPACQMESVDIEMDGVRASGLNDCSTTTDATSMAVDQRERPVLSNGEAAEIRSKLPRGVFKYWLQRYSLFSRFDNGIQMDTAGWFSATPECIASHQAKRCACDVIVDAFTGVGGNAIQFANTCAHVIAIDSSPARIKLAKHNAQVYGVDSRIEFICADFFKVAPRIRADVVFISPPWGGPSYQHSGLLPIDETSEIGQMVIRSVHISRDIVGGVGQGYKEANNRGMVLFLPKNSALGSVQDLKLSSECMEVEAIAVNENLKAVTTYIGNFQSPM